MRIWALRRLRDSAGQYTASVAVVAVVSAFAVLLIETIDVISRVAAAAGSDSGSVAVALGSVGAVFLGIAVLTAGIVISNTFTTVYAGRLREIALLRLIGATSRQVRRTALGDGALVGVTGAVIGVLAGVGLSVAGIAVLNGALHVDLAFGAPVALWLAPLLAGTLATTAAAFSAARGMSRTSPTAALGSAATAARPGVRARRIQTALGLVVFVLGALLLAAGCLVGAISPLGVLIGFLGGTASILGTILAAPALLIPPLRWSPRLLPRSGTLRLAAANLVQEPLRTARTVLAVTIGVALITMFTVVGTMLSTTLNQQLGDVAQARSFIDGMLTAIGVLTSFSVIVAAIGVASTLSLSVLQRRRELGMLRATGLTRRQARRMLLVEAVLTTGTGTIAGLVLGVVYGFAGYTSTVGSVQLLPPQLPPAFIPAALLVALLFGIAASLAPAHRAATVPPAEALRTL
jgi:putative ABC transport system permease protein